MNKFHYVQNLQQLRYNSYTHSNSYGNRLNNLFQLHVILTRPAFFLIEHRGTESVCYYAIKSLFDVLYLDM
jgi:hypothetical protein